MTDDQKYALPPEVEAAVRELIEAANGAAEWTLRDGTKCWCSDSGDDGTESRDWLEPNRDHHGYCTRLRSAIEAVLAVRSGAPVERCRWRLNVADSPLDDERPGWVKQYHATGCNRYAPYYSGEMAFCPYCGGRIVTEASS